jgi:hypothetical protein
MQPVFDRLKRRRRTEISWSGPSGDYRPIFLGIRRMKSCNRYDDKGKLERFTEGWSRCDPHFGTVLLYGAWTR